MRKVKIGKVVLHITVGNKPGWGREYEEKRKKLLEKAKKLLEKITGKKPCPTYAKKRIPAWKIYPGALLGYKVTLRKEEAEKMLNRLLDAIDRKVKKEWFDEYGNFSFGIKEYIDIPGIKYDPEIGMFGLDVSVSLERPGYRIQRRRRCRRRVPRRHRVTVEDAIEFLKEKFDVEIV